MRESYTAVVERARPVTASFESEPYEAGWADEVTAFVKVREGLPDGKALASRLQISPDGIDWVDFGVSLPPITGAGMSFATITGFGNWVRVVGDVDDPEAEVRISVYLALKG